MDTQTEQSNTIVGFDVPNGDKLHIDSTPEVTREADGSLDVEPHLSVSRQAMGKFSNMLVKQSVAQAHEDAKALIQANARHERAQEDLRADRRNRNRALTLLVALLFTFLVPYMLVQLNMVGALKFATGISIVPDALITFYAYWKKY